MVVVLVVLIRLFKSIFFFSVGLHWILMKLGMNDK